MRLGIYIFLMVILSETIIARPLKIAFSRCSVGAKYERYAQWVKEQYPEVTCIDLYAPAITEKDGKKIVHPEKSLELLRECDGLIITGGPDIHPGRFGKSEEMSRCEVQAERDTLEFALYHEARRLGLPVLGICRGMQLINVAEGGSLYTDIPSDIGQKVSHRSDSGSIHLVTIQKDSYIYKVCGTTTGTVNSFHHQSVDRVGQWLQVTGTAADGVAETLEQLPASGKSWLLGVQWHPERLAQDNPFSREILKSFIAMCNR